MININCLKSLSLAFLVIRSWVDNKKLIPFTYVLERSCEITTVKVKTIFYFLECKTNSLDSLVMLLTVSKLPNYNLVLKRVVFLLAVQSFPTKDAGQSQW